MSDMHTINYILSQFRHMGATEQRLEFEKKKMINNPSLLRYNKWLLDLDYRYRRIPYEPFQ